MPTGCIPNASCLFWMYGGKDKNRNKTPDITGKNVVLIIAHNGFNYKELIDVKDALESANASVYVASTSTSTATSSTQETYMPDLNISMVNLSLYDAIVFIGGPGVENHFLDHTFVYLAYDAFLQDKVVAAICIAPCILANAGILNGRNATVYPMETYISIVEENGGHYVDEKVVVDGNIITCNGPDAAWSFGAKIVGVLAQKNTNN
ncbi:MAG: DJ-1 family protein [Thermoplasmata archaeon]|nr:MAG: DJ-1 family protein [Thermoplasmata archaeon]